MRVQRKQKTVCDVYMYNHVHIYIYTLHAWIFSLSSLIIHISAQTSQKKNTKTKILFKIQVSQASSGNPPVVCFMNFCFPFSALCKVWGGHAPALCSKLCHSHRALIFQVWNLQRLGTDPRGSTSGTDHFEKNFIRHPFLGNVSTGKSEVYV